MASLVTLHPYRAKIIIQQIDPLPTEGLRSIKYSAILPQITIQL